MMTLLDMMSVCISSAEDVNPYLYDLEKQGLVKLDGKNPRWKAVRADPSLPQQEPAPGLLRFGDLRCALSDL